eukprot:COSAG01_NODE_165_length_23303_cov_269.524953_22_plen_38_part_01
MMKRKSDDALITTVIGEGTHVNGNINSVHSIRIEGNLD